MLRVSISSSLVLLLLASVAFFGFTPQSKDALSREQILVSIAELVQRESEVTRELHMLKFGQTLNLMALLESEQNFSDSEHILLAQLTSDFSKRVRELNRVSRHRKKYISAFKSNWAIHRNSRSSVLRVPSRIVEASDPAMRADLLSYFHGLERDFLIENDIERNLRTLPGRLSNLEKIVDEYATEEGVEYFAIYKRHFELYIESLSLIHI